MDKRILFIIAQVDFRDEEYLTPKQVLEQAGVKVITASVTTDKAKGSLGAEVVPDIAIKDANLDDYDMVVAAGGSGAPKLYECQEFRDIFLDARQQNKPFGAICISPATLAKIGVLEGKTATVYKTDEAVQALRDGGALYSGKPVEIDGNIVTANGPMAAKEFGMAILNVLGVSADN